MRSSSKTVASRRGAVRGMGVRVQRAQGETRLTEVQIKNLRAQMAEDERRKDIRAYNEKVPRVNALVRQYNEDITVNRLSRSLLGPEQPDIAQ